MSFNPFINGGGGTSSEDKVARAEIAAIKDGETLDSFSDVETALDDKADSTTTYTKTEVDTALGNKADKSTTYTKTEVDTALGNKVDKVSGKGLSTNDYTDVEKTKLAGIAEGAEVNEIESIKVNNTTINPDANKVVNITVPTTAADVSALPDTTKYAAALSLTINSSTFVMTGQLKDQNGDNLGTAQTIDLPLESVVVGGSYNSQTKKVVLTLQNGNTVEFSVADLVSGLQTELSASNKLNPAYINYDSTHRAVSDTEKSTWNGKQDALTTAQLAAANSGINSEKVAQYDSTTELEAKDRAALVELVDGGAKNFIEVKFTSKSATSPNPAITNNSDGSITINGSRTASTSTILVYDISSDAANSTDTRYTLPAGKYIANGTGNVNAKLQVYMHDGTDLVSLANAGSGSIEFEYTAANKILYPYICWRVNINGESSFDNFTFKPMVCSKAAWDISHTYQPYRPSDDEQNVIINSKANLENIAYKTAASLFSGTNMQVVFDENMFSQSSFRGSVLMMFGTQKTSVSNTLLLVDFYDGGIKSIRYLTSGTGEVITAIGTIHNNKHGFNFTADANSYTYPCCLSLFANKDIRPKFTVSVIT